jgi:hypothetical protein
MVIEFNWFVQKVLKEIWLDILFNLNRLLDDTSLVFGKTYSLKKKNIIS